METATPQVAAAIVNAAQTPTAPVPPTSTVAVRVVYVGAQSSDPTPVVFGAPLPTSTRPPVATAASRGVADPTGVPSGYGEGRGIAAARKRWVLVVDDDEAVRAAIVGLIGLEPDLAAVGAGSTERALRVLAGLHLDAVVVDLVMPGANGLDLIVRLRAHPATRDLPIVVATAAPAGAVMRRAAAAVYPVVGKPLDPDRLVAAIRSALDSPPAATD